MNALLKLAVPLALVAGSAHAAGWTETTLQAPSNCFQFQAENGPGSAAWCFNLPLSDASRQALEDMRAREAVQVKRMSREQKECGTIKLYPKPDSAACFARIDRDLPFPAPNETTLNFLHGHSLEWE